MSSTTTTTPVLVSSRSTASSYHLYRFLLSSLFLDITHVHSLSTSRPSLSVVGSQRLLRYALFFPSFFLVIYLTLIYTKKIHTKKKNLNNSKTEDAEAWYQDIGGLRISRRTTWQTLECLCLRRPPRPTEWTPSDPRQHLTYETIMTDLWLHLSMVNLAKQSMRRRAEMRRGNKGGWKKEGGSEEKWREKKRGWR